MQQPPTFSALRVGGRRAYALARAGKPVELKPRMVTIYEMELLNYAWPDLQLRIDCGRGTYIRSIARDLGQIHKTGGYLQQLKRTRIGEFDIKNARQLADLTAENVGEYLQTIES